MCTVSYLPLRDKGEFILTSNRDERVNRITLPPKFYTIRGKRIVFPKDAQAGGSWIAAGEKGRLGCLLNGARVAHQKLPIHTHSRGKVLIDLVASAEDPVIFFSRYDLSATEPFTIVSIDNVKDRAHSMLEFIWDGATKALRYLDPGSPYLWSSVTLYDETERETRNQWFDRFLEGSRSELTPEMALEFHSGHHTADKRINLLMQRDDQLRTVSITQMINDKNGIRMAYHDMIENEKFVKVI